MPRPRKVDRPIDKKMSLRESVVMEIDTQLADPLTKKPRYGAWAELVESLLNEWASGNVPGVRLQPKTIELDDML